MRPRVVRIVDVGLTSDFAHTSSFRCSLLAALGTQHGSPSLVVTELIRTDRTDRLVDALAAPADVIHVVAHGSDDPTEPGPKVLLCTSPISKRSTGWAAGIMNAWE